MHKFVWMKISDGKVTLFRMMVAFILAMLARSIYYEYFMVNINNGWPSFFNDLIAQIILISIFISFVSLSLSPNKISLSLIWNLNDKRKDIYRTLLLFLKISLLTLILRYCIGMIVAIYTFFFQKSKFERVISEVNKRSAESLSSLFGNFEPSVLTVLFTVPVCEELIYRGFILNYLLSRYKINFAIVLSAVVFALFHGAGYFSAFLGGIYLGILYVTFKRLDICIIAHITSNLLILILNKVDFGYYPFLAIPQWQSAFENLIPALLLSICYIFFVTFNFFKNWDIYGRSSFSDGNNKIL